MKYDVNVNYETTGKNSFGESETLNCSRVLRIEADNEKMAIEIAKKKVNQTVKSVSVCERKDLK